MFVTFLAASTDYCSYTYTIRLASTFSCIFTGEGTIRFMGCKSTGHRDQRLEQRPKTSCQDTTTGTYPNPPSPAKIQCALQLRGPGQAPRCLSPSFFSLAVGKNYIIFLFALILFRFFMLMIYLNNFVASKEERIIFLWHHFIFPPMLHLHCTMHTFSWEY